MGGSLVGVVVGGLITHLTTRGVERQRWRHERREKLSDLQRNAVAGALEWIEPMRIAQARAESLVMAAIQGDFDHEQFLEKFSRLLSELVKKDVPADQRAVLPDNIYDRGYRIVCDMDRLSCLGVRFGQEAMAKGKRMAGFKECSEKLDTIHKQILELETDLREAFRRTFD